MSAKDVPFGLEVSKGLIAQALMALIGFVGTIIFATTLGPAGFGGFYLLLSIVRVGVKPIDGIAAACTKRMSESNSNSDAVLGAGILSGGAITVVALMLLFSTDELLAEITGIDQPALYGSLLFTAFVMFTLPNSAITSQGKFGLRVWLDLLRSVLTFPLQLFFVFRGMGSTGMALGLSLATMLTSPLVLIFYGSFPTTPQQETWISLWSYARHSIPSSVVGNVYDRADVLLLGALVGPGAVGYYEVAFKLTEPAIFISTVVAPGLVSRVSNKMSEGLSIELDVQRTVAFTSLFAIPLMFGVIILATEIITIVYDSSYRPAVPYLVGLGAYRFLRTQTAPLLATLNGMDRPDLVFRISAFSLFVNLLLGVLLVFVVGPIGVVGATVFAELIRYCLSHFFLRKDLFLQLIPSGVRYQVVAGAVMLVSLISFDGRVGSWFTLIPVILLGAGVYFTTLLTIHQEFRVTVQAIYHDAR